MKFLQAFGFAVIVLVIVLIIATVEIGLIFLAVGIVGTLYGPVWAGVVAVVMVILAIAFDIAITEA